MVSTQQAESGQRERNIGEYRVYPTPVGGLRLVRLGKGSREAEATDGKQRWQEKKASLGFL